MGLVDQLSHQGHDPIQHFQTKELLAKQAAEGGTKPGTQSHTPTGRGGENKKGLITNVCGFRKSSFEKKCHGICRN